MRLFVDFSENLTNSSILLYILCIYNNIELFVRFSEKSTKSLMILSPIFSRIF